MSGRSHLARQRRRQPCDRAATVSVMVLQRKCGWEREAATSMELRHISWHGPAGSEELILAAVPGVPEAPFPFGHGTRRKGIRLASFYIGTTPVTQGLWEFVMGDNPAVHRDPRCPVENVSWERITGPGGFLDRINRGELLTSAGGGDRGLRFRLPTEAEWEYAARGGPHWPDDFAFSGSNDPDAVAWYGPRWTAADQALVGLLGWRTGWRVANRIRKLLPRHTHTHPVARKAPNQLSLHDMSGNVWEWCQDVCTDDLEAVPGDGTAYLGPGTGRRLRGGCHHNWDLHCRVWWRYGLQPDAHDGCIGFRLVLAGHGDPAT
ncbi:MAG TPA: formylglycine-generating enzyme family protein [Vicinamibacterales bacterium]|nr:formylglycine-generating enzyme family protein [Vicinamibacterales bacterium]